MEEELTRCPACNAPLTVISENDDENDEIYLIYTCDECGWRE